MLVVGSSRGATCAFDGSTRRERCRRSGWLGLKCFLVRPLRRAFGASASISSAVPSSCSSGTYNFPQHIGLDDSTVRVRVLKSSSENASTRRTTRAAATSLCTQAKNLDKMASYSTIPATEDLGLPAATPPKNTLGRKGLATLAAICVSSALAGSAAPSAARGLAKFATSSSSTYKQIQVTHAPGAKTHGTKYCLSVLDHHNAGKGSAVGIYECKSNDYSQQFLYTGSYTYDSGDEDWGSLKWKDQSGKHYCVSAGSGGDVELGSTMKLWSCKDIDDQHFDYDIYSKKFALDFDDEDDQYCMGWDELEDSAPVIASKCFEDQEPYNAKVYWKIL